MLSASAVKEIQTSLKQQGGSGKVWIDNWNTRYGSLGTIRDFLQSWPGIFKIIPEGGSKFSVSLNSQQASVGLQKTSPRLIPMRGSVGNQLAVATTNLKASAKAFSAPRSGAWGGGGKFADDAENSPVAADALRAIRHQLMKQGGSGQVWLDDWQTKYLPATGLTLRMFLENHPDQFKLIPGFGNKFTVALVTKGTASVPNKQPAIVTPVFKAAQKPYVATQSFTATTTNGAWDPTVAGAMKEIKGQLLAQGGSGQVWVDNWHLRFGSKLGQTVREFLESRPDKFTVTQESGTKFSVALADHNQLSNDVSQGSAPGAWNPVVAEAVREIKGQLQQQGGTGQVWVENWKPRFGAVLGDSVRVFLESRPDKFTVVAGDGNKFTVSLAGSTAGEQTSNGTKRTFEASGGGWNPAVAAAITEVKEQLRKQGGSGQVWIDDWKQQFEPVLCMSLREFLESRPDKFTLEYGEGRKFSVSLAQSDGEPSAKKAKTFGTALADKAINEIEKQLKDGTGKVWIPNWSQVYQPVLGHLREFLESRADKFVVEPDEEKPSKFLVSLI